jgi:hypothetical protein
MSALKQNETELQQKDGKLKLKGMHDAVEVPGNAHAALRAQNLATGGQFIHQPVQRWQEYTE